MKVSNTGGGGHKEVCGGQMHKRRADNDDAQHKRIIPFYIPTEPQEHVKISSTYLFRNEELLHSSQRQQCLDGQHDILLETHHALSESSQCSIQLGGG